MEAIQPWIEKLKINDLLSGYTLSIDRHDPEGWANCFTEDGLFGFGDLCIRGRDNLRAYASVHASIGSRHLTSSPLYAIAEDGQSATGNATTVVTASTSHGYKIIFIGSYSDTLKKVEGKWRIAERWVKDEPLPSRPDFFVGTADPEIAEMTKPLFEAFQRLGEKL